MSTNIELQQLHTLARNSVLIHTAMDHVIFTSVNHIKILNTDTDAGNIKNAPAGTMIKMDRIKIDDPYFLPKSPIFNLPKNPTPLAGISIGDEFNTGGLSRNLFVLVDSFGLDDTGKLSTLENIQLYLDHTSALFIQTSVSYVILYPEKFLNLKNLDNKSRQVTIKDKIKEKYRYVSDAESESFTDFISLLIDTLGSNPDETGLLKLLNDIDKNVDGPNHHDWKGLPFDIVDIKNFTNTQDLFHRLSNSMKPDLISGIPRNLALESGSVINDLVRVVIDIGFMEKILDIWRYLLESDDKTPFIISFLEDELPRIFAYFEEAKPLPPGEQFVDISRVMVKKYLDTFLNQNIIAKLTELSGRPSSDAAIKIFRSLRTESANYLPDLNILNFLFTVTFTLQENPSLSTLHIRSEQFDGGYTGGTGSDPVNKVRIDASPQIFPGIIFKDGRAQLLESVGSEQDYNGLKNGITDLDLRIGQVGQLQDLLKLARGIPL